MKFCPKCKALLVPKMEGTKSVYRCSCGYKEGATEVVLTESVKKAEEVPEAVKDVSPHPLTEVECPKCHHRKAYYWMVQTRASDEPETKFYKCENCEHIWRDYS